MFDYIGNICPPSVLVAVHVFTYLVLKGCSGECVVVYVVFSENLKIISVYIMFLR